jgi:hypothetical protein
VANIKNTNLNLSGKDVGKGIVLPKGTTAQQQDNTADLRFNTDKQYVEHYYKGQWRDTRSDYGGGYQDDGLILLLDASDPACYPGYGVTCYDLSGQNNHGTMTGTTWVSNGNASYWNMTLNANNNIAIGESQSLNYGHANWTYNVWVYPTFDDNGTWTQFFVKGNADGDRRPALWYYSGASSRFHITWNGAGQSQQTVDTSDPFTTQNTWQLITITARNGTMRAWRDGVADSATTTIDPRNGNNYPLYIGQSDYKNGNWQYRGPGQRIGYFSLHDRALSDAEIVALFNSTKARFGL